VEELWRRDVPQLYNAYELPRTEDTGSEFLAGAAARTLSRDRDSGSTSSIIEVPPRWNHRERCDDGTLELFVLQGDLGINEARVGTGGFVALCRGGGDVDLASSSGAIALAFWNPDLDVAFYYGCDVYVTHAHHLPWQMSNTPGARHGWLHKSLRLPDPASGALHGGPSGYLRLVLMAPGVGEPRQEVHHACREEILLLSGDFLMPERGLMGAGTFFANPAHLRHGPMANQHGAYMLVQTDAPQDTAYRYTLPAGPALTEDYLQTTSLLQPPRTLKWRDTPQYETWCRLAGASAQQLEWPRYADPSETGG
jgi:hypothetical protein